MQFITSLFGGSGNTLLTAAFALGVVLVLIVLGVWLLKLIFAASSNVGRGRNRRLSVVDSLALDPKRQLLIIRRDNVEHLILTGGSQDVVVESGIPVHEQQSAQPPRRPLPGAARGKPLRPVAQPAAAVLADPARAAEPAKSLRHTGLLRTNEPSLGENPDQHRTDSAKENPAADQQSNHAEHGDTHGNPGFSGHGATRG